MVNASSCAVDLWIHLGDVSGGLLSSEELEVSFIYVINLLNGIMRHNRAMEFDYANILAML